MSNGMWALTFDRSREDWASSTGLVRERVAIPRLEEPGGTDRSNVIIKVKYAGFCGSDRGIWWRKAFGDMILNSLDQEQKDRRIVGHELLGE
ncbi:MAG: alcohol dehydrogenase catalytic domain-containing protein, partial [Myxococcota bacterium]|nr:alcohol dehydrogenase catalytic domain-containing protein [Myxococcota bacterium]